MRIGKAAWLVVGMAVGALIVAATPVVATEYDEIPGPDSEAPLAGYTRSDGSEEDDEYRILVEFWLTAFPKGVLGGRHRG